MSSRTLLSSLIALLLLALPFSACTPGTPAATSTPEASPTVSPTPSATAMPMAAIVNGEGITQEEYQAEVARYLAAQEELGNTDVDEAAAGQIVLEDLIDQVLLAQGATEEGYVVEDAALETRIQALAAEIGGSQALADWQAAHGYSDAGFRLALRRQMAGAWMRDRITSAVPPEAEQVHAKQILLYNSDTAQDVYAQLQAGADFDTLAARYDPLIHGELGWFPRGYLLHPALDEAAFSLEVGQYSQVIETTAGFHILKVLERESGHSLSPDAHLSMQRQALNDWLAEERESSEITRTP